MKLSTALALSALLWLTGCGVKGDLYLPKEKAGAQEEMEKSGQPMPVPMQAEEF